MGDPFLVDELRDELAQLRRMHSEAAESRDQLGKTIERLTQENNEARAEVVRLWRLQAVSNAVVCEWLRWNSTPGRLVGVRLADVLHALGHEALPDYDAVLEAAKKEHADSPPAE